MSVALCRRAEAGWGWSVARLSLAHGAVKWMVNELYSEWRIGCPVRSIEGELFVHISLSRVHLSTDVRSKTVKVNISSLLAA